MVYPTLEIGGFGFLAGKTLSTDVKSTDLFVHAIDRLLRGLTLGLKQL